MSYEVDAEKTLEAAWKSFSGLIIPETASNVQRREMKRSFYAGCLATFSLLTTLDCPDGDAVEYIESLSNELREFNQSVERGEA